MKKRAFRLLTACLVALSCCITAAALPETLIPGGCTVGIKLYSQGLVVTGFDKQSAAREAGLKKGDVILQVDGEAVHTAISLRERLEPDSVILTVLRKGREAQFRVEPQQTQDGRCLGAYIRDSMAGIGTVTYYDPDTGAFGALGHGVADTDAEILLPIEEGVVVHSSVTDVKKGKVGTPGELKGKFDVYHLLGSIAENTDKGIFGTLTVPIPGKPFPVAQAKEVKTGGAEIWSNISGTQVQHYSVEILKIYPHSTSSERNLLLKVTDPRLLDQTGGIVQGMSGSPILQNGKIIGAVTHVLVNQPDTGYGIFIENMLDAAA